MRGDECALSLSLVPLLLVVLLETLSVEVAMRSLAFCPFCGSLWYIPVFGVDDEGAYEGLPETVIEVG